MQELPAEGSLAELDLAELVQRLQENRWNGSLWLHRGSTTKTILVTDGRLAFGMSSNPDERLGEMLLRRGRITLRQLVDASREIAPGRRLGSILVAAGILDPRQLVRSVVEHSREIIFGAFTWEEGRFRLEPAARPDEAVTLNISTPLLILEGIRRIESWSRIDRAVGGLEAVYRRRPVAQLLAERLAIEDELAALVYALERSRTVEQLCEASTLSSFEVCRALWGLRLIGAVERVPEGAEATLDDEGLGAVLDERH